MTVILTAVNWKNSFEFGIHSNLKFSLGIRISAPLDGESNKLNASYTQHDIKIIRSHVIRHPRVRYTDPNFVPKTEKLPYTTFTEPFFDNEPSTETPPCHLQFRIEFISQIRHDNRTHIR